MRNQRLTAVLLIVVWCASLAVSAQNNPEWPVLPNINKLLADFQADSWEVRAQAFYQLLGGFDYRTWLSGAKLEAVFGANPDRADKVKRALIGLLAREGAYIDEVSLSPEGTLTEDFTNYHGDLIGAVAALKDPRSIDALLGAITTGGMAGGALADFGPLALDGVLAKSQSPDFLVLGSALGVLGGMLSPEQENKLDDTARQKARGRILQAAADDSWPIRVQVARTLADMPPDAETIAVLRRLAESDPAVSNGRFPVRQAAERALREIEGRR